MDNRIEEVARLNAFVDSIIEKASIDLSDGMDIRLALEEVVVNVMNYAYPEGERGEIKVTFRVDGMELHFVVIDSGKP